MRGFSRRTTVDQALAWLHEKVQRLESEQVPLAAAANRVLAADVTSPIDVPRFERAMMDGFAVQAADTLAHPPTTVSRSPSWARSCRVGRATCRSAAARPCAS